MRNTLIALLAVLSVLVFAGAGGPPGNNGTVKVHDASEDEPIIANEPKVCAFHLHFFFSDPTQDGDWVVRSWPPTGDGTTVLSGSYNTSPSGEYQTAYFSLPDGHYKLEWQGRNEQNIKHKVFWVECTTPTPSISPSPSVSPNPSPSIYPSPSASPSPTPTPTLRPTSSPSPSITPTPTPTPTKPPERPDRWPLPSLTPFPTPTPTLTPSPTPNPTPALTLPPTDTQ